MSAPSVRRRQGNVVEQTKTHAPRLGCMMARRPHQAQRGRLGAVDDRIDSCDARAGGGACHIERIGRNHGIGVEHASPFADETAHSFDYDGIMNLTQGCLGQWLKRSPHAPIGQTSGVKARSDGAQALGCLDVRTRVVA